MTEEIENEMNKLTQVQAEIKAPKNQYNAFGKFNYRSCEDITEALKPILADLNGHLIMKDKPVMVGDWHYMKSTVTITFDDESYSSTGYAREPLQKKGMDESQVSGASSSYARKYALNGLLALDDAKDADDERGATFTEDQATEFNQLLNEETALEFYEFNNSLSVEAQSDLANAPRTGKTKYKQKIAQVLQIAEDQIKAYVDGFTEYATSGDDSGIEELILEIKETKFIKRAVFIRLDTETKLKVEAVAGVMK